MHSHYLLKGFECSGVDDNNLPGMKALGIIGVPQLIWDFGVASIILTYCIKRLAEVI